MRVPQCAHGRRRGWRAAVENPGLERGAVLGVYQSSSAMARFVGQAGAGTLYGQLGANAPFLLGSLAMLPAYAIAVQVGRKLKAAPLPGDKVV